MNHRNIFENAFTYGEGDACWHGKEHRAGKEDGLEPTKELKEYIEKEKRGEITTADIKVLLDKRYKE